MESKKLIVGLGNHGKTYEKTRHNLGYRVVRLLAKKNKFIFKKSLNLKSLVSEGKMAHQTVTLILALTYMNSSGLAIKRVIKRKKIDLRNLLIILDDVNLDFGSLRIRPRGSDGGHLGLKSVIEALGSSEFSRLRIGIGRPSKDEPIIDYVLSGFNSQEEKALDIILENAVKCCITWLRDGVIKTMDKFNK